MSNVQVDNRLKINGVILTDKEGNLILKKSEEPKGFTTANKLFLLNRIETVSRHKVNPDVTWQLFNRHSVDSGWTEMLREGGRGTGYKFARKNQAQEWLLKHIIQLEMEFSLWEM